MSQPSHEVRSINLEDHAQSSVPSPPSPNSFPFPHQNILASGIRDQSTVLCTPDTISQLASVEASTLRAPEGLHDDRADSFALTIAALADPLIHASASSQLTTLDPLDGVDLDEW